MSFLTSKYLEALYLEGSFSKAASRLNISQPSLSQFISRIESQWGVKVIDRSARPLRATPAGLAILKAEAAMDEARSTCLQTLADLQAGTHGHVRLGVSEYREMYFLNEVLPVFRDKYPDVELSLIEATTDKLEDFVLEGVTDVSVVIAPSKHEKLSYESLFVENHLLAVPKGSPLLCDVPRQPEEGYLSFDFRRLDGEPFLLVKAGQRIHDVFNSLCRQTGARPKVILESESLVATLALAGAGVGATIVPDTLAKRFSHQTKDALRYFEITPVVPPRTVVCLHRFGHTMPKAVKALIDTMKEVASERF